MKKAPHIKARKDARTLLYRAVFGPAISRSPHDLLDRKRPQDWVWENAVQVVREFWKLAAFQNPAQTLKLINTRCPKGHPSIRLSELN